MRHRTSIAVAALACATLILGGSAFMPGYNHPDTTLWRDVQALERRLRTLETTPRFNNEWVHASAFGSLSVLSTPTFTAADPSLELDVLFGTLYIAWGATAIIQIDDGTFGEIDMAVRITDVHSGAVLFDETSDVHALMGVQATTGGSVFHSGTIQQTRLFADIERPSRIRVQAMYKRFSGATATTLEFRRRWLWAFPR